jgi:hypothetical protein
VPLTGGTACTDEELEKLGAESRDSVNASAKDEENMAPDDNGWQHGSEKITAATAHAGSSPSPNFTVVVVGYSKK